MSSVRSILCSGPAARAASAAAVLALLAACGQRGPLYLPTEPEAANRATLPQTLRPGGTPTDPTPAPRPGATEPRSGGTGTGTAAPVRTP